MRQPAPIASTKGARPVRLADRSELTDEDLARLSGQGDHEAFAVLMTRHRTRLHAICHRVTGNPEDALDALQETLIRAFRNIGRFRAEARFTTWLYRIAVNASCAEIQHRRRRPSPLGEEIIDAPAAGGVESQVVARLSVQAALSRLPAEYRVAIVLRDLCECPYEEIAEALRLPMGTVKSRIARGRAALLRALGPDEPPASGGDRSIRQDPPGGVNL